MFPLHLRRKKGNLFDVEFASWRFTCSKNVFIGPEVMGVRAEEKGHHHIIQIDHQLDILHIVFVIQNQTSTSCVTSSIPWGKLAGLTHLERSISALGSRLPFVFCLSSQQPAHHSPQPAPTCDLPHHVLTRQIRTDPHPGPSRSVGSSPREHVGELRGRHQGRSGWDRVG